MYLLDTDVLSNLMKLRRHPDQPSHQRVRRGTEQFTTSVTLGELLYGANRSSRAALLERI